VEVAAEWRARQIGLKRRQRTLDSQGIGNPDCVRQRDFARAHARRVSRQSHHAFQRNLTFERAAERGPDRKADGHVRASRGFNDGREFGHGGRNTRPLITLIERLRGDHNEIDFIDIRRQRSIDAAPIERQADQ
jgi:hypothetical protein